MHGQRTTDLVNVMTVFKSDNGGGNRGGRIAVLRSADRGSSWSGPITISQLGTVGVTDPDTGDPVRTGDIIPENASDERAGNGPAGTGLSRRVLTARGRPPGPAL